MKRKKNKAYEWLEDIDDNYYENSNLIRSNTLKNRFYILKYKI